jgi:DNA-binding beta-propeller fold protein YncE
VTRRTGTGAALVLSTLLAAGCASRVPAQAAARDHGAAGHAAPGDSAGHAAPGDLAGSADGAAAAAAAGASAPRVTAPGGPWRIYVGTESADAVAVVDGRTWTIERQIPVGISVEDIEGVHGLRLSPDGRHWYITLAHGFPYGTLWKFTTAGDSLAGRAELGNFPATIGITPDGAWAFVVNYNLHGDPRVDTVSAVYTPTMTEVAEIPVCTKPHGLDVSADGRFVVVTCTRDDAIVRIDVGTLRESARGTVRLPDEAAAGEDCYATGVQLAPDGTTAWVSCGHANEVRTVDLSTFEVTDRAPGCAGAYLLEADPEARTLWVPCRSGGEVVVLDAATLDLEGRIATTREFPHTVAFTPDGRYALLTQESRGVIPGAVDVVDRRTLQKVGTMDIGLQATGIGVAGEAGD